MIARILISILVGVIVFLAVKFILDTLLVGIAAYAFLLGLLSAGVYFFTQPYLTRR